MLSPEQDDYKSKLQGILYFAFKLVAHVSDTFKFYQRDQQTDTQILGQISQQNQSDQTNDQLQQQNSESSESQSTLFEKLLALYKRHYFYFDGYGIQQQLIYLEEYQKLTKTIDQSFKDEEFPPTEKSLGDFIKKDLYQWRSLMDQYGNEFTLFPTEQRAHVKFKNLPRQGKMGDCYFISSLSSVFYNHPEQLKSLIVDFKSYVSCIKLCVDGQWCVIWIDNYFPFNKKKNVPAFTKKLDKAVWAMIFEKAWCKMYGNYKRCQGGHNKTVLRCLTGAPCSTIKPNDKDFALKIEYYAYKKYPMTCNSKRKGALNEADKQADEDSDQKNSSGLSGNHAYCILKVLDGKDSQGNPAKFLIVRNPWGFKKWKGDQKSEMEQMEKSMVQDDQQHQSKKESDNGVFHIDVENFIKFFQTLEVCYYEPSYVNESIRLMSSKRDYIFCEVTIKKAGQYFFSICQKNPRFFKRKKGLKYGKSPSVIGVIENGSDIIAQQKYEEQLYNHVETFLEEKTYLVYANVKFTFLKNQLFETVMSSYGLDYVKFQFLGLNILNIEELNKKIKTLPNYVKQFKDSQSQLKKNEESDSSPFEQLI